MRAQRHVSITVDCLGWIEGAPRRACPAAGVTRTRTRVVVDSDEVESERLQATANERRLDTPTAESLAAQLLSFRHEPRYA